MSVNLRNSKLRVLGVLPRGVSIERRPICGRAPKVRMSRQVYFCGSDSRNDRFGAHRLYFRFWPIAPVPALATGEVCSILEGCTGR